MLVLTILCGILALQVPINKDRTKYLSDSSNMKHGMDLMEDVFPDADEKASIRVMFDDLTAEEIPAIQASLEAIPYVSSVTYEAASDSYNKDNHTLFVVSSKYDYSTDEERSIEQTIASQFSDYSMIYQNNDLPSTRVSFWLLFSAVVMAVAVLLVMCHSWLEPVLLLLVTGAAVILNFGSNIFLPYIDEMTASVGPVIQMVLSMDYSIILINRYRQEKERGLANIEAMKGALAGSISSIASSSLTTVVGLLALVFLSFKLGPELGFVLAKGVFLSMVAVFTIFPTLILLLDGPLERTKKKAPHIPMGIFANFSRKVRFVMPVIFVALFAAFFVLQNNTRIAFTENIKDPLADVFPKENTLVLIYDNKDENKIDSIIAELEKDEHVSSILGFPNTLGKDFNAADMSESLQELSEKAALDTDFVRMIYYMATDGTLPAMTASQFMNFVNDSILPNDSFREYFDDEMLENTEYFEKFSKAETLTSELTSAQMADFFGIAAEDIEQLYLYHTILNGVEDSGTMTLPSFVDFVLNTVAKDELYGFMFDEASLESLKQLERYTDKASVLAEQTPAQLAATLGMDEATVNTVFVLHNAGDVSGKTMTVSAFGKFLSSDIMSDPMFAEHFDDTSKAQLQSLTSIIKVAESKYPLSAAQMGQVLGMDAGSVSGLYSLYFSSQPQFQMELAQTNMSVTDFLALLKANTPAEQQAQLLQMEQLINLALSGQMLDAGAMATITGMPAQSVSMLYMYSGTEAMTLPTFLSVASRFAPDNAQLQQMAQIVQLAVSGEPQNAATLAAVFGLQTTQVYQLFGMSLAAQKSVPLADFTAFLVNSVLTDSAYVSSFTPEQAAQLSQMNQIVQLAASGTPVNAQVLARVFGMESDMVSTAFRLYFGADISEKTMSLSALINFILADDLMGSMMEAEDLAQLEQMQEILDATVNDKAFTSEELADFMGMEAEQAEQLYILRLGESDDASTWTLSPQNFVSFVVDEILGNEDFADYFDEQDAEDLKSGHTLIEAVVAGTAYTADGMTELLSTMSDDATLGDIEVLYLLYASMNSTEDILMTIPEVFNFIHDEMLNDVRFSRYFDEETSAEIVDSKAELNDAILQMKGDEYSRLVITSNYPDESDETLAFVDKINTLRTANLSTSYLIGSSAMISEMSSTFDQEYSMITILTAVAIFLVVLIAFRNPTLPLILTLLVQCGVYITVTVIGAYSGSLYYLALLIVQSILMGATIDYGIVFCNFYQESRKTTDMAQALKAAYEGSIHTIMTSGTILVFVLVALGVFVKAAMISEVCITLAIGAFVAILLILIVLPSMVAACDRLIHRKAK